MRKFLPILSAAALGVGLLGLLTCSDPTRPVSPDRPSFSTTPPPPVLLAAGDIASCDRDQGDVKTAALINTMPEATVVTLGDNAYDNGTATDYANCYHPTWGQFKARTRPSMGNHEYGAGNAIPSFDYFGDAAWGNSRPNGYYSFNLGEWHVIVLNDNNAFVSIGKSSAQVQWLKADLAANAKQCILAVWHQPLFSSAYAGGSPGYLTSRRNLWAPLYEARADLILNAHKHVYERYRLQDPDGNATPGGLRQITVGTGGSNTGATPTVLSPNAEVVHGGTDQFGVLKLTLNNDSYSWQFIPVGNNTFTDEGTTTCHGGAGTIAANGGNGQSAAAGTAVPIPPSVVVTDPNGSPVEGVSVTFSVQSGGGSVTGAAQSTGAAGVATVGNWTLGTTAGNNALIASAAEFSGSPILFTATGTPGPASAAVSTATVPNGVAGKTTTFTVRARDAYGNAVSTGGATVAVQVSGANSASPTVTDNGNGTYTAQYTPIAVGTDNVAITLDGTPLSASPYQSAVAPKIVKVGPSGDTQTAPVGSAVPAPPSAKVTDGAGTPLAGVTVTFTVQQGGGTVVPTSRVTGANGIATVDSWTVGPVAGTNKLRAAVSASSYVAFWATGQ